MNGVDTPAPVRPRVAQPPLSLTKGAAAIGVSTSTLRRAIEGGKLQADKTVEGHYRIPIDQLMQYKANEVDTQPDRGAADLSTEHGAGAPDGGGAWGANGDGDTPGDVSHSAVQVLLLRQENGVLKQRADELRQRTRELEQERDDWKGEARELRKHAGTATRLLTDERERHQQQEAEAAAALEAVTRKPRSRAPLMVTAAVVAVGAVVVGTVLYPERLRGMLEGQGADVEAASLEVVEPSTPVDEGGSPGVSIPVLGDVDAESLAPTTSLNAQQ